MSRIVHIVHFDLDGAVSSIILNSIFDIDKTLSGGYHRLDGFINQIRPTDTVICSDVSLSVDQYKKLINITKKVMLIDHHPDTALIVKEFPDNSIIFDVTKSASRLCYDLACKKDNIKSKEYDLLVGATDAYDLYDYKGRKDWFDFGYDLNILFWEYMFYGFVDNFNEGFKGYSDIDIQLIKDTKRGKVELIRASEYVELESDDTPSGLIAVTAESHIINDIPFAVPGHLVYFMISTYQNGTVAISIRTPKYDLTDVLNKMQEHELIDSCGGHPNASGMSLIESATTEQHIDVIQVTFAEILKDIANGAVY